MIKRRAHLLNEFSRNLSEAKLVQQLQKSRKTVAVNANGTSGYTIQKGKNANCTVTCCHSGTPNLSTYTKQADILIAAIGVAEFVTRDMVKPGALVVDVGINRVKDDSRERGYRLVGDVDFDSVSKIAEAISCHLKKT